MSQENVEIVRAALAAWVEVDEGLIAPDRLSEFYARDAEFTGELLETGIRGLDGFLEWWAGWIEAYDDWSYEAEKILDAGANGVAVTFHQRGRVRGGEAWVEMRYGIVYSVEAGLVTGARVYSTPAEALEAAGVRE